MRLPLVQRLRGWPRRVAAVLCLLAAAATALAGPHAGSSAAASGRHRPSGLAARLRPGQLAVPVTITDPGGAGWVHPGDHVGLLAGPDPSGIGTGGIAGSAPGGGELVADHLRVLAAHQPSDGLDANAAAELVVAADHDTALRIAAASGRPIVPVLDDSS